MLSSLFADITLSLLDDNRYTSRSISVYQRKPDPNYVLVPGPRLSRANGSVSHCSISPFQEDAATQGDIFNDSFLRQVNPSSRAPSEEPEPEPEEERVLEHKRPVASNIYEDNFTPENAKYTSSSVYDTIPPFRYASESITSQSSVDSVPSFPPPSSDEAIKTLQDFMIDDHSLHNEGSNPDTRSQRNPAVYENLVLNNESEGGNTRRKDDGIYDNVMIRNVPAHLEKTNTTTVSADSEPDRSTENLEGDGRLPGIKQVTTRDTLKGGQNSRPTSTLNESYEWSKVMP